MRIITKEYIFLTPFKGAKKKVRNRHFGIVHVTVKSQLLPSFPKKKDQIVGEVLFTLERGADSINSTYLNKFDLFNYHDLLFKVTIKLTKFRVGALKMAQREGNILKIYV